MDKKEELKLKQEELIRLVSSFCKEKLDEEYEELCIKMIQKLYRKRNCPFERGSLEIWAASIIYTIGRMNFLFDKSFVPYIPLQEIHDFFGTKKTTVTAKAKLISDLLHLSPYFDKNFSTSFTQSQNPFNQLVEVDGLLIPLESLPEELQQKVKEARSKGYDISFTTTK